MPVFANEENGVKPVSLFSSDYIADIPIKKRRFPIIRTPSPPHEDTSLLSVENSLQKGPSLPFPLPTCSNVTAALSSSKLSDQNKNPESKVRRGSYGIKIDQAVKNNNNNNNYANVEGTSLQSRSLDGKNTKKKLESKESVALQAISKKSKVPSTRSLAVDQGNSVAIDHNAPVKVKTEVYAQLENAESFLTLDKHGAPVFGSENNDKNDQNLDRSEPISLNLFLSELRSSSICKRVDDKLKIDRSHLFASRVNWDLNTTMDAWDGGSVSNVASGLMSVDGSKSANGTLNMKPKICSTEIVGVPFVEENHAAVIISSPPPSQHHKSDGSLHLLPSSYCPQPSKTYAPSTPSLMLNRDEDNSTASLPRVTMSSRNLITANNLRNVKSEPADESNRLNQEGANTNDLDPFISRVKEVLGGQCSLEIQKSNNCASQLAATRSVKPEPSFEGNKDAVKLLEKSTLQLNCQVVEQRNSLANAITPPVVSDITCSAEKTSCGTELTIGGHSDQLKQHTQTSQTQHIVNMSVKPCASRPISSDTDTKLLAVDGKVDATLTVGYGVDHPGVLDVANISAFCSSVNGEGSVSDEEKINLSGDMLEEDSYGSDYESDGNHDLEDMAVDTIHDCGDDDYEDGEVREPPEGSTIQESMPEKEEGDQIDSGNCDNKKVDSMVLVSDAVPSSAPVKDNNFGSEDIAGTTNQDGREVSDVVCTDDSDLVFGKNVCLPESSVVDRQSSGDVLKGLVKITERSLDKLGSSDVHKCQETGLHSELNNNECEGTVVTIGRDTKVIFGKSELVQNEDPPFPKGSADADHAFKESSGAGHRSRIINLPRSSNLSYPGKVGSISGRGLSSRVERERLHDNMIDGDKVQPRGRDDSYFNNNHKFSRERYQDRSARNSRINFSRGRGRIDSRRDNLRGDWGSGGERSPGWGRGIPMVRRIPRNIGPGRCGSEDGSELVGPRRSENFIRGFSGGTVDPMFSRTQQSYEGEDGRFDRGNKFFSSVQRRGPLRIRSKSPISSRNRSPRPWSSPRRSPRGFNGHSNLTHRRSPPFCRMERMTSPDHPCFPGEGVDRRHDLRDSDSGCDHGHSRSAIPSRSPSGRIILRNRRFDVIETQVRLNDDEYFGAAMHRSVRSGDGISDDRRRFGERRGPIRTFRPPYDRADGENFHLNSEDGPRPFRFCPEDDVEFQQRGNLRDREFDRRIKNGPGNACSRRMRGIEEEDANYRHGGQAWHDDGFDDISRLKRKRY